MVPRLICGTHLLYRDAWSLLQERWALLSLFKIMYTLLVFLFHCFFLLFFFFIFFFNYYFSNVTNAQVHLKLNFTRPLTPNVMPGMDDLDDLEAGGVDDDEGSDDGDAEQPNELHITVVQGRRLEVKDHSMFGQGSSDPQVRLKIVGFEQQKTPYIRKNLNPVWNSRHIFPGVLDNALSLVVIVEDHNDIKTADFMGKISIPLNQFNDKKPSKKWYKLRNKAMEADGIDRGEVELLIHWKFNVKVNKESFFLYFYFISFFVFYNWAHSC